MHTAADIQRVTDLLGKGLSDYEISRRTGINRSTVLNWRTKGPPTGKGWRIDGTVTYRPWDDERYSYLLGAYLGDGHIASPGASCWLRLYLDAKYRGVINECAGAMAAVLPVTVRLYSKINPGAIVIHSSSRNWPRLFPQHGPGRKHERKISLEPWQTKITHEHTQPFLRGLIHSDGSRCMNRFSMRLKHGRKQEYEYPRYFFTNHSTDILRIFWEHCELLGIRCTQSKWKEISVSHRDSVALMDDFIGPKQ